MRNLTRPTQQPEEPAPEPGPLPSGDSDIIADIIASLVDQENGTSRPPSYHGAFSFEPLQPSHLERVNRDSGITSTSSRYSSQPSERSPSPSPPESYSHDFVADVFDALQPSKHPSFSRPSSNPGNINPDSAISLQPWKHKSAATILQAHDFGTPPSPSDPELPIQDEAVSDPLPEPSPPTVYPSPAKTAIIMFSLYISIFLVALDRTIIGPAIPEITNKFHSTSDIGWYGSAYMLTSCGFILLYGRVYTFFTTKYVFLSGILLFEAGSAICGAASSSLILIIGRAIAGFGSSGIFTGAILIMLNTVPLHRRPLLQGLFGACFGVASVAGPLLGGAFTGSSLTWRWCFYINLPLGGFTVIVVLLFLRLDEQKPKLGSWKNTVRSLDPVGTVLFLPSITCLLLALEWGAAEYAWSSPRIIALLTVFAVLFCAFIAWQYWTRHTTATVPARILFQRSVAFGGLSQFFVGSTMLTVSIYIPLWFQAIKDDSAIKSGIHTIPLVLSVVVGSISSGGLVQRIGYYTPFMILGSCFMAIGTGLLTTWNVGTQSSMWIGFQIILGLGVGFTMQHPNLAIQVVLPKQDVATGTALLSLCQTLGGAVFVAVGQNVFIDKFTTSLEHIGGLDPARVVSSGATDLKTAIPLALQQRVLEAYNTSLTHGPFLAAVFVACLSVPSALGMEWRSVKEDVSDSSAHSLDEERMSLESGTQGRSIETGRISEGIPRDTPFLELPESPKPIMGWKRMYKSSDDFTRWLTAKVNPDLRDEIMKVDTGLRDEIKDLSRG
ncbi:MFS general substrate transporter [Melanomma pulvis-pyrius CBS 109.77]|uniref:MFS general substrate transporter n=1 Tax=Melanomma pulvis-pyrius CBS 109.77 TaxID=1314802 RepID=A0A6A6XIZ7_9PLEO|nr:MFS general substrate transporter [Melanomma pulvis-pyrius CBS 109.77]